MGIVWVGEHRPFGSPHMVTGAIDNSLRFPGQYFDFETGLHQNWYRDYQPDLGRYIEADLIGLRAGMNQYAYVQNNPLTFIDPNGLHWRWENGRFRPHRHVDGFYTEYPGPGSLDGEGPDHYDWKGCTKCDEPRLLDCLIKLGTGISGCPNCRPDIVGMASCISCGLGWAGTTICYIKFCKEGRVDPCTGECK
jgi:RHS repeat-associated protein